MDKQHIINNDEESTIRPTHAIATFDQNGVFNDWETTGSLKYCKQYMAQNGNPSFWSIIPTMQSGGYWVTNTKAKFSTLKEEEQETKRIIDAVIKEHDLQQKAEDNHILDIEVTDREAPTINQLEAHLNPNPDHQRIADINEFNEAWAEAEHQANVYYHDTGD